MTQSFPFRDAHSELVPEAVLPLPRPNMMPPWKQSDLNATFMEKPGQKRRRDTFGHQQQDQYHVYNDENHATPYERGSSDSAQVGNGEPDPGGPHFFSGLEAPPAFPRERRGFCSRILETSSRGLFPFRAQGMVQPSAASVFVARNLPDLFGARDHQRNLESAEVATAQAMANFQALIDQGRSTASGVQACGGANATQEATLPVSHRQAPSFSLLREQQQQQHRTQYQQHLQYLQHLQHQEHLQYQRQQKEQHQQQLKEQYQQQQKEQCQQQQKEQYRQQCQQQYQQQQQQKQQYQQQQELPSNHGLSLNSSLELPSSGFNYFSGFQDTNSSASLAFGDPASATDNGAHGSHEANETYEEQAEPAWPNLTCNTSVRIGSQPTILFQDPPSPCTPRAHTVVLSDAQKEYLQHMESLNSEAHFSADSPPPPPPPLTRRLSFDSPVATDERISVETSNHATNSNIFHPFELDYPHEKYVHLYFDDPQRHGVAADSVPNTQTQVDECAAAAVSGTRGIDEDFATQQEENFSLRLDPPVGKEISRDNTDQFDLNEVPVISVGEATPAKKKKFHPRVAKDKRTYKRRVDRNKGPGGDGVANADPQAKKSSKKRPAGQPSTQYDSTHEEGRDSSYPEVVDMDIEDMATPGVGTQHDTAICDCEACIKARLERRSSTAPAPKSRFTLNSFDDTPQKIGSRHSPDASSNSPSVRRTLFHARQGASARRLRLAFDDSSSEQAKAGVDTLEQSTAGRVPLGFEDPSCEQANSTAWRLQSAFDDSSSEQTNAVVLPQANSTARRSQFTFDDPSSEQPPVAVLTQSNSTPGRLPLGIDDSSSPEEANAVLLSLANSRLSLNFDDSSSPEESNAVEISQVNSTAMRLRLTFDDASSLEESNTVVLSQSNSTALENARSYLDDSTRSSCLQQFNDSATQLGFNWEGRQQKEADVAQGAFSFDWNPSLTPRAPSSTTSSSFLSRLCPRSILSPQKNPFRNMNQVQRVVYLKSILSANPKLTMSPESLLRHVHGHLPEEEKQEFQDSLWPVILKLLTGEQLKLLQEFTSAEILQVVDGATCLKRKPGPKPRSVLLVKTLFPSIFLSTPIKKPSKPRKKKSAAEESPLHNPPSLEIVPYETNNSNVDTAMVPYDPTNNNRSKDPNGETGIVPYATQTSMVPFEGPVRKKKTRPKVELDGETVRVWKLLMGKPVVAAAASAEGAASDAENERKWEEERTKMKAQALLFIDRMHVVQGDRSFSCWKGSVVDSVVGAFLTQNVNDVLSSSAFMSMRSRFPGRGFRNSPLQTKTPEDESMAQSFDGPRAPEPPTGSEPSPQKLAPQISPQGSIIAQLESQASGIQEFNCNHIPIETVAPEPSVDRNISWTPIHEDSAVSTVPEVFNPPREMTSTIPGTISEVSYQPEAVNKLFISTISEVTHPPKDLTSSLPHSDFTQPVDLNSLLPFNQLSACTTSEVSNQPRDPTSCLPHSDFNPPKDGGMTSLLPSTQLSVSTISEVSPPPPEDTNSVVLSKTCHSENSSGLEYQTLPEDPPAGSAATTTLVELDVVVSSLLSMTNPGALVESFRNASHGKYNPKTGLTGLERAKIEEKQVTARKSFDFSLLNKEFRPRTDGEKRAPGPPRTEMTEDGVDWEAVRAADVQEVADVIKERGLNWILAGRIKAFLARIHQDYGELDLEWLRSMSTDETKEFLLSIRGLGLKSVECIRLLTLHHLAFPVDTNVGRICVRLGWVPLEPLPEELQLHLLELYPVQATIQKYLWPRLCKLDQQTLYELHYQMITFGKVFCTKSKPNCNACPMRPECKHFASALSSAKLALPAAATANAGGGGGPTLALPPGTASPAPECPRDEAPPPPPELRPRLVSEYCQPIVEEPMTPESESDLEELDIEDYPFTVEEVEDDTDVSICIQEHEPNTTTQCSSLFRSLPGTYVTISEPEPAADPTHSTPTIIEDWRGLASSARLGMSLNGEESGCCPQSSAIEIVEDLSDVPPPAPPAPSCEVLVHPSTVLSHEMVLVPPGAASLPVPKLKNVGRLRTVHYVYELPDKHQLLNGLDSREHDDPCTYLLAIWSPGEVPESIPNMNDSIDEETPFAASSLDVEESIKATLLVPCRTAMRGSFPLNGTYFQVNEVFADHSSSLQPMIVPRSLLWNLRRRFVYFGTSVTSIFRGMTVEEIQACFWRGYVCVRGFDRATRAPKPLVGRLHLQSGKSSGKGANTEN